MCEPGGDERGRGVSGEKADGQPDAAGSLQRDRLTRDLPDETATVALGRALGKAIRAGAADAFLCVYLQGELGAGKTTLCRGLIREFGHPGNVKSPTYTLVEPYELSARAIYHFDLYRLAMADELQFLGLDDYFQGRSLCVVEWPERGDGFLPPADLECCLFYEKKQGGGPAVETADFARSVSLRGHTEAGVAVLAALRAEIV